MHQQRTAIENIVGKEEIAHNEQFLLFPQYFLLNQIIVPPFVHIFDIIISFAAELGEHKIGISGKGLTLMLLSMTRRSFMVSFDQNQTIRLHGMSNLILNLHYLTKQQNFGPVQIQSTCR